MKKIRAISLAFVLLSSLIVLGNNMSQDTYQTEPDFNTTLSENNEIITNISDNIMILNEANGSGTMPAISDNGCVVWSGSVYGNSHPYEIFYWNGLVTKQVTTNGSGQGSGTPQINANGIVVWDGFDGSDNEIFIYDGTITIQITNNSYDDYNPVINDLGQIAWQAEPIGKPYAFEIFFWDGSNVTQITNNSYNDAWPQINNQGQVTWKTVYPSADNEIFFWNGSNVTQLTNNTIWEGCPKINNNGNVAWASYDGSDPYTQEIYFWNGSSTIRITNNDFYDDDLPDLSDNDQITWYGVTRADECNVYFWNGLNIKQINTLGTTGGFWPKINYNGHIAWPNCTWTGNQTSFNFREIYFWDGLFTHRITDDRLEDKELVMNNEDQIAWMSDDFGGNTSTKICFLDIYDVPESSPGNATGPQINLTAPNGGEIWSGGSSQNIVWDMEDSEDSVSYLTVDIYYSTDGGLTYPNTIAANLTGFIGNPCIFNWNPVPIMDSNQVRVRVVVTDTEKMSSQDESLADFTIDSTPPLPATNVTAELTGTNDVTIYWTASASMDVAYYRVYYITNGWNPTGDTYVQIPGSGDIAGTSYTHAGVGNTTSNNYCYQVRTFDYAGHETRTYIQAAKMTKQLSTAQSNGGWFMVGSFLAQSSYDISYKLQGLDMQTSYDLLETYNAWDNTDHWKTYPKNAPVGVQEFGTVNNTQGFWIHVTSNCRYASAGHITNMSVPLKSGWNLVPYPYAVKYKTTQSIVNDLIANCSGFNGGLLDLEMFNKTAPYKLSTPTGTEALTNQDAFWVRVTSDSVWTVVNY